MSYEYSKLHNVQENDFSKLYFSSKNINVLQNELYNELLKHGYKTKPQCHSKIISYMNNIYEIYANPYAKSVSVEIKKLNKLVLDKMVSIMITEIKQYIGYIKDASTLPQPIAHPKHISTKKSLEYENVF